MKISRSMRKIIKQTGHLGTAHLILIFLTVFLPGSQSPGVAHTWASGHQGGLEYGGMGGELSWKILNQVLGAGDHLHSVAEYFKSHQHLNTMFRQV